jgi:subtilisin family serine protease
MHPLELTNLTRLMQLTSGRSEVLVGLIDGPVAGDHPDLDRERIRVLNNGASGACTIANSVACRHGTLVAGVLMARRDSGAMAICPGCTLLVRPIFAESKPLAEEMPAASPDQLTEALRDCIRSGCRIVNLSAALVQPSTHGERHLTEALDEAGRRDVLVVAAAGNQGAVGSTAITRHPWVIPVAACDAQGRPLPYTNLGGSIGRRGLLAPGRGVSGLDAGGGVASFDGTSAAAPFVSATAALLWSEFPQRRASEVRLAVTQWSRARRSTIVPPLLNAWAAYQALAGRTRMAA